jgi:hypothetical protein
MINKIINWVGYHKNFIIISMVIAVLNIIAMYFMYGCIVYCMFGTRCECVF